MIKGLENEAGELINDEHELTVLATKYYKDLFSSKLVKSHDRLFEPFLPCIDCLNLFYLASRTNTTVF